jgi:ribosomal protein L37AE/L43A
MNAQTLYHDLTARGVRLWAEADKIKLDAPIGVLSEVDIVTIRQHKAELLESLRTQCGNCPFCHESGDLQDRQLDVWWCGGCRKFFDGQGRAIQLAPQRRPVTLEQVGPQQLAADLLAAGCSFIDEGESFQTKLPINISGELLACLLTIDRQELRLAVAKLTELEHPPIWVN